MGARTGANGAHPEWRELAAVCRRLTITRRRTGELEDQRDALIQLLRRRGISGAELSALTGLTQARITQISQRGRAGRAG